MNRKARRALAKKKLDRRHPDVGKSSGAAVREARRSVAKFLGSVGKESSS